MTHLDSWMNPSCHVYYKSAASACDCSLTAAAVGIYAQLSSLLLCYDLRYQLIPCCLMHVNNPPFPGCNMKNLPVIYSSHCNMLVGKSVVSLWYKLFISTMHCIANSTLSSILWTWIVLLISGIEMNLNLDYETERAVYHTPIYHYLLHKYICL